MISLIRCASFSGAPPCASCATNLVAVSWLTPCGSVDLCSFAAFARPLIPVLSPLTVARPGTKRCAMRWFAAQCLLPAATILEWCSCRLLHHLSLCDVPCDNGLPIAWPWAPCPNPSLYTPLGRLYKGEGPCILQFGQQRGAVCRADPSALLQYVFIVQSGQPGPAACCVL